MGQALYDHVKQVFETTVFYDENSVSPFLINQPPFLKDKPEEEGKLRKIAVLKDEGNRFRMGVTPYPIKDLPMASINEIEDSYLAQAHVIKTDREVSVFALNACAQFTASTSKRGIGWVTMMHPSFFESFPYDGWIYPEVETRIGRWTLIAKKIDRFQHVWVCEDIEPDVIYTAYRSLTGLIDGMVVCEGEDGYHYIEKLDEACPIVKTVFTR